MKSGAQKLLLMAAGVLILPLLTFLRVYGMGTSFVFAVIDNDPSLRVYQQGVYDSQFVFEELGEDGKSRLLVLHDSRSFPDILGPIKDVTPNFAWLASPTSSLLLTTGTRGGAAEVIRNSPNVVHHNVKELKFAEEERNPPGVGNSKFIRAPVISKLLARTRLSQSQLPFLASTDSDGMSEGVPAARVEVVLGNPNFDLIFEYNPKSGAYKRSVHGVDSRSEPENVVVLVKDPEGKAGSLLFLQGGSIHRGFWRKSGNDPISLFDESGNPLPLLSGQTWIVFVEAERQVLHQSAMLPALANADLIRTRDVTPVIISDHEPNRLYGLSLFSPFGELLERATIRTDKSGVLIYKPDMELSFGKHHILIRNEKGFAAGSYALDVSEDEAGLTMWVTAFGRKNERSLVKKDDRYVVGGVERSPGQVIQGYVRPNEEVAVEFHSISVTERSVADERGYFELPIPHELGLGEHTANLAYLSSDGILANDLLFSFALLPGAFEITKYDASLLPWYERNPSLLLKLCLLTLGLHILLAGFSHSRWGHFKWLSLLFPFSPSRLVAVREVA